MQKQSNNRRLDTQSEDSREEYLNFSESETNDLAGQHRGTEQDDTGRHAEEKTEDEDSFVSEQQKSTNVKNEILNRERENEKLKLLRKNRRSRWNDIL